MKNFLKNKRLKQNGYVTLMIMLIVASASFALVFSTLNSSVSSSQAAGAILGSANARAYADACIEDALYLIYTDPSTAVNHSGGRPFSLLEKDAPKYSFLEKILLPQRAFAQGLVAAGSCDYNITSSDYPNDPSSWYILANGYVGDVTKSIEVSAQLSGSTINITDWNETAPAVDADTIENMRTINLDIQGFLLEKETYSGIFDLPDVVSRMNGIYQRTGNMPTYYLTYSGPDNNGYVIQVQLSNPYSNAPLFYCIDSWGNGGRYGFLSDGQGGCGSSGGLPQ